MRELLKLYGAAFCFFFVFSTAVVAAAVGLGITPSNDLLKKEALENISRMKAALDASRGAEGQPREDSIEDALVPPSAPMSTPPID